MVRHGRLSASLKRSTTYLGRHPKRADSDFALLHRATANIVLRTEFYIASLQMGYKNFKELLSCWSIRKKLSFLLLILFLPASGIIIASSLEEREHEMAAARDNALLIVQSLAAQQEKIVTGTKQMLSTLAQFPEVQRLDSAACNKLFNQLNKRYPFYAVLAAATPDGNMFAASTPFEPNSINLSDRKHIKDAVITRDFSAGEYVVGRLSKVQSINYAFPVFDADKNLIAILVAGFKLDEFALFIKNANLPEGSVVVITDHKGARLFRMPESDRAAVGTPISEKISGALDHGIFEKTAVDGVHRIYAFKQLFLGENQRPYLNMLVGLPKDKLLASANFKMFRNLAILGFALVAAISLVWLLANFVLVKPIGRLVVATQRFGGGEMDARTHLPHTSDELGQLAQSFDNMASLLEMKDRERKKAEEALLEAQEELVRKEKLAILGQLSGSVGHELRNPLGVMSNAVYFLKMVLADADDTTKEYLDIIKHEIGNSLRIITDLLDFARTKPPQIQEVTARALLDKSLGRCAIPDTIALQTDIPDNLPLLRVDPLQMEQVLTNFITNGVQAMPNGGALRVAARFGGSVHESSLQNPIPETADSIEISIQDTGEGISAENMNKIFQPLFTTKPKGIGLGLVVCKNLVEANAGRIEVTSEVGTGTTFTLILPVQRTANSPSV